MSQISESIEMESRSSRTGGEGGRGAEWGMTSNRYRNVLKSDCGDGCTTVNIPKMVQWFKWVNTTWYVNCISIKQLTKQKPSKEPDQVRTEGRGHLPYAEGLSQSDGEVGIRMPTIQSQGSHRSPGTISKTQTRWTCNLVLPSTWKKLQVTEENKELKCHSVWFLLMWK